VCDLILEPQFEEFKNNVEGSTKVKSKTLTSKRLNSLKTVTV